MNQSKMFPFITKTNNPLGGECQHKCKHCWARMLAKKYHMKKYTGPHRIYYAELEKLGNYKKHEFVFVCSMKDLFESTVPTDMIQEVLNYIETSPANFLLLTQNPKRYKDFKIPKNCVCGATIETDKARMNRITAMKDLKHPRKMISIEPIMKFSPNFQQLIISIKPDLVAIGYDNYNNNLDEPLLFHTTALINGFKAHKLKVYEKTIRESHEIIDLVKTKTNLKVWN